MFDDENPISPPVKTALWITGAAAAVGGLVWWFSRPKAAGATVKPAPATTPAATGTWARVPKGQPLLSGQVYRFSIPDLSKLDQGTEQAIAAPFSVTKTKMYAGSPPINLVDGTPLPADWPKDDPNTGPSAAKVEATADDTKLGGAGFETASATLTATTVPFWQMIGQS